MKMKREIVLGIFVTMLIIVSAFAGGIKINAIEKEPTVGAASFDDQAELPEWKKDYKWVYDVSVEGSAGTTVEFNIEIEDLKFKVTQVQSDQYTLDVDVPYDGITGDIEVELPLPPPFDKISGQLDNTKLDGTAYVQKSTLGFVSTEETWAFEGSADVKVGIIPFNNVEVSMGTFVKAGAEYEPIIFTPLQFPLGGNSWAIPEMYLVAYVGIAGGIYIVLKDNQHTLTCSANKKTVSVPAGSYEAFEITHSSNNKFWYAPEAGNIVKVDYGSLKLTTVEDEPKIMTMSLYMELKSTTYEPPNDPPEAPDKPSSPDGGDDGRAGVEYTYCTSGGNDPNGDQVKYGFDWKGDGTVDDWTDWIDSGEEACATHTYSSGGDYTIKAKTEDKKGAKSDWSSGLTVHMEANNPPDTPDTPSGPTEGMVGESYTYSTNAVSDPDGDIVKYKFDWGDGDDSGWLSSPEAASHSWSAKGGYDVKVKAKDNFGATSDWSGSLTVNIANDPPEKPSTPSGPTSGKEGNSYTYSTSTTDPDGHRVKYCFDWGDGETTWTSFVNSGQAASASHTWDTQNDFQIKVKAQDEYGEESEWSEPLSVSMPRSKQSTLFMRFLEKVIDCFPVLAQLLNLQ